MQFKDSVVVFDFKYAVKSSEVEAKKEEGVAQLQDREYTKGYDTEGRKVISAVLVADDEKRQVIL